MITVRWASFVLAVITLGCLFFAATGPVSVLLAGLFLTCFVTVCWSFGAFRREEH